MPTLSPMPAPAPPPEVRFVLAAPSPYTGRFDATRAGLGIALELHRIAREHQLPLRIGFRALPMQAGRPEVAALLAGPPRVLVVGGSTWSQGSAAPLRRLFELGGEVSLQGVRATAFATAGGAHTGGEMVVLDSLRSLMGQGALQAHAGSDPPKTAALAGRLGVDLTYYRRFPRQLEALGPQAKAVCARINPLAAANRPGLAAVASALDRPAPEIRALFGP